MKMKILTLALLFLAVDAFCAPYFKLSPMKDTKAGAFVPIGKSLSEASFGAIIPIYVHDAADGYLLLPGVSWDLLDVGYVANPAQIAFGPSVHLDEPVKTALRFICRLLPAWNDNPENYGLLRSLLTPADADSGAPMLAAGPMLLLDAGSAQNALTAGPKALRGSLSIGITLKHAFGAGS